MTERPEDRARRLSAALRANLRKRKAQARKRGEAVEVEPPSEKPAGTDRPDDDGGDD